jgi:adenylate cyclase
MPRKTPKSEASQPPAAAVGPVAPSDVVKGIAPNESAHLHAHLPHFHGLLQKIKQRNVGRVAILYIVVCYVILEPFEMFFHLLDLPVWTGRTAVALMVLGFPVALLLAWIYEITPTGIKPSTAVDPQQSIARQTGRKLDFAIIGVLAVALIYFVADKFWISKRVAVVTPTTMVAPAAAVAAVIAEKSVAVLPFVDMSEKKDQEYFSDGLSEELIDMLTKVPDLRVPARTSSFYFKGKQTTIADIAKALSVAHVLEGSVRKSGNRLRITAQLIRVDTGYHLWSQTFDRDSGDIFKIQDDISTAVVSALKASLGGLTQSRGGGASNSEAYDLYLLAESAYERASSKEDYQKIVDELQNAIRSDPAFARAWAMLSGTLSTMAGFGFVDATKGFEDARTAALKAIELSPDRPESHRALAKILYLHDWDWGRAEIEIKQAVTLGPDDPANLTAVSLIEGILGRGDNAVQYAVRAVSIDPLSSVRLESLGRTLRDAGRFDDALAALRRAQKLNPSAFGGHWSLGLLLLLSGKSSEALAEFELDKAEDDRLPGRALAYFALGRTVDADSALRRAEMLAQVGDAYTIAQIHAYRGERDQSFAWLNRAFNERDPDCGIVKLDPLLKNLRPDPRYKAFLRKMRLPE